MSSLSLHYETEEELSAREKVLSNPDLLEMIFTFLDPFPVRRVRLVSRLWRSVMEVGKFWTGVRLEVDGDNLNQVLGSRILQLVTEIRLNCWDQKATKIRTGEKIFTAIASGEVSQLRKIDHLKSNFREKARRHPLKLKDDDGRNLIHFPILQCSPELLSQAADRLEEINLGSCTLPTLQTRALLAKIIDSEDLKLKTLCLDGSGNRLAGVPVDILIRAAVKLEHTNIHRFLFFPEHVNTLFRTIAESPVMRMKSLDTWVYHKDLSVVSPAVLSAALVRLEEVSRAENLTQDQLESLFKKIASCDDMKLRRLDIYKRIDLSAVPSDTLAEAVVRLKEVNISGTNLSPDQVQNIFSSITNCPCLALNNLDISQNDLSSVSPEILAESISRLDTIHLHVTCLTSTQVNCILNLVGRQSTRLRSFEHDDIRSNSREV